MGVCGLVLRAGVGIAPFVGGVLSTVSRRKLLVAAGDAGEGAMTPGVLRFTVMFEIGLLYSIFIMIFIYNSFLLMI